MIAPMSELEKLAAQLIMQQEQAWQQRQQAFLQEAREFQELHRERVRVLLAGVAERVGMPADAFDHDYQLNLQTMQVEPMPTADPAPATDPVPLRPSNGMPFRPDQFPGAQYGVATAGPGEPVS